MFESLSYYVLGFFQFNKIVVTLKFYSLLSHFQNTDGSNGRKLVGLTDRLFQQTDATQLQPDSRPASRAGNGHRHYCHRMTLSTRSRSWSRARKQGTADRCAAAGWKTSRWSHSLFKAPLGGDAVGYHPFWCIATLQHEVFSKPWRKSNCRFMFSWIGWLLQIMNCRIEMMTAKVLLLLVSCCYC